MGRVKNRNYRLTIELLRQYSDAALSNATDLVQEATLLEKHGHTSRAYFLAVAALEETGKAILAFDGQGRNISNPEVSHRLKLVFEDHQNKIMSAFTPWLMSATDIRESVKIAMSLASDLSIGREPSMYTDIQPEGPTVQLPTDVVRNTAAVDCIRLASDSLTHAKSHVQNHSPMKMTGVEDELFSMKPDHLHKLLNTGDFWEYHIIQVEAGNNSFANSVMHYQKNYLSKRKTFKQ